MVGWADHWSSETAGQKRVTDNAEVDKHRPGTRWRPPSECEKLLELGKPGREERLSDDLLDLWGGVIETRLIHRRSVEDGADIHALGTVCHRRVTVRLVPKTA